MSLIAAEKSAFQVLDLCLSHRVQHTDLPGLQVCIRRKGKIVFSKAYGVTNNKTKKKLTTKHLFCLASHSKMVASCALHRLEAAGKLKLSDKLTDHVPELCAHRDKRFKKITLEHLLSHRSGIVRDGIDADYWQYAFPIPDKKELLSQILAARLFFAPGKIMKYSNLGFSLLGLVVENVTGETYADFVQNNVFSKLNSDSLYADDKLVPKARLVAGHSVPLFDERRHPLRQWPIRALASAAGFCANAEGASLFLWEFLYGKKLVSTTIQKKVKKTTWSIGDDKHDRYGLGLADFKTHGFRFRGHTGSVAGFTSCTSEWVGTDYIFSVTANANLEDSFTEDIRASIAALLTRIDADLLAKGDTRLEISPLMRTLWESMILVFGKKAALEIHPTGWNLGNSITKLRKTPQGYVSTARRGYNALGESVVSLRGKDGQIIGVSYTGWDVANEALFRKRTKKALLP